MNKDEDYDDLKIELRAKAANKFQEVTWKTMRNILCGNFVEDSRKKRMTTAKTDEQFA